MSFDAMNTERPLRIKVIACEIFYRELCLCAARSTNIVDLQFLTQGLHDLKSANMSERVQREIDAVDPERYAAVALGFALCNNGIVGLGHARLPLIVPKSHDCIALFLGSRGEYDRYFGENPGTYYKTSGWIERDAENLEDVSSESTSPFGALRSFEKLVEKYGEENAQYVVSILGGLHNYSRMTYIRMPGVAPLPYDQDTRERAEKTGLVYDEKAGDFAWLQALTDGPWDADRFLVVPPGGRVEPSYDEQVLKAVVS
ncbi:DUF1638 domain-containing protein [bacterium]|nr:DUF1638 domain-containing protein [bacterium]